MFLSSVRLNLSAMVQYFSLTTNQQIKLFSLAFSTKRTCFKMNTEYEYEYTPPLRVLKWTLSWSLHALPSKIPNAIFDLHLFSHQKLNSHITISHSARAFQKCSDLPWILRLKLPEYIDKCRRMPLLTWLMRWHLKNRLLQHLISFFGKDHRRMNYPHLNFITIDSGKSRWW